MDNGKEKNKKLTSASAMNKIAKTSSQILLMQ